ncbi:hypothetical protein LMG18101_05238 [Ralstonia flaminis]|uniref:Uncharacterized protein n=2 Tax=Ralstonia flaminis TaxID=3058597 RepID=A0ABM9KEE2_9RALS|nr:hypothetical protein LMG18101_05238 [Ralstonia sp. LMG 18101]
MVGQGVGIAIGAQDKFSWSQVGRTALSAGVTAGIGGGLADLARTSTGMTQTVLSSAAARVGVASAMTQGIGVATGLQSSFNWRGVAAAAAGGQVGAELGGALNGKLGSGFAGSVAQGSITGFAGGMTTAALQGGRIAAVQVATDAFGNALGGSLVDQMGSARSSQEDVLGQKIAELQRSPIWNAPGIDSTPSSSSFDSDAAYNQLVAAFSAPQNGTGRAPGVLLAANGVTEPGQPVAVSDAVGGLVRAASLDGHAARVAELQAMAGRALSAGEGDYVDANGVLNVLITGTVEPQTLPMGSTAWDPSMKSIVPDSQVVARGVTENGRGWERWDSGATAYAVPNPVLDVQELPPLSRADVGATFVPTKTEGGFWRGLTGDYRSVMEGPAPLSEKIGSGMRAVGGAVAHPFVELGNQYRDIWSLATGSPDSLRSDLRQNMVQGDYLGATLTQVGVLAGVAPLAAGAAGRMFATGVAAEGANANIVYRALTSADGEALAAGRDIVAKAPSGTWTAAEHVANAGPGAGGAAANSPWVSTTKVLDVARAYEGGNGIIAVDLNKVGSLQAEVWRSAPRVNGVDGLAYHRSIWAQEVTIYQTIPKEAIKGFVK